LPTQKPDNNDLARATTEPSATALIQAERYPLIDVLKAFAVQFIVLHHLSLYGPVSDALQAAWPRAAGFFCAYGLLAVQVFLVIGGYLAARGLASSSTGWRRPGRSVRKRYSRLAVPYLAALAIVVLCSAPVRPWLSDDLAAPLPDWPQVLAHITLLHSILGIDSLSAGAWYVAMDFQLFAALTLLLWLTGGGQTQRAQTAVALLCAASLLVMNRHPELDAWALYFFGAYGLGALAWWARRLEQPGGHVASPLYAQVMFVLALFCGLLALALDFRIRVALALGVALALMRWGTTSQLRGLKGKGLAFIETMSQHSYALFLIHFPVFLLINAAYTGFGFSPATASPASTLAWGLAGWASSLYAAKIFYRWIESPTAAWRGVLRLP
jgi:peptidoglycan/LPS O-acetylase OafA/YrhL